MESNHIKLWDTFSFAKIDIDVIRQTCGALALQRRAGGDLLCTCAALKGRRRRRQSHWEQACQQSAREKLRADRQYTPMAYSANCSSSASSEADTAQWPPVYSCRTSSSGRPPLLPPPHPPRCGFPHLPAPFTLHRRHRRHLPQLHCYPTSTFPQSTTPLLVDPPHALGGPALLLALARRQYTSLHSACIVLRVPRAGFSSCS